MSATSGAHASAAEVYRVEARNAATTSENRIHDDAVARQHGFDGGLVPGVTVYGYMTGPVVRLLGREWLERGTISVRFHRPVYNGQTVEARAERSAPVDEAGPTELALALSNPEGVVCASGRAALPVSPTAAPDPSGYPVAPAPDRDARPPADDSSLAPGTALATQWLSVEDRHAAAYLAVLGEDSDLLGPGRLAPPGFLILSANSALSSTVRLGPWVHTDSEVTNLASVPYGQVVETRGYVADRFDRGGHAFVVLELLWLLEDRPVMHARHTAIYRLRVAP